MITIKGNQYPLRLTMGAMLRFKRETGKEVSEINQQSLSEVIVFIYACLASASIADGIKFDLSLEEFADSVEVSQMEELLALLDLTPTTQTAKKKK